MLEIKLDGLDFYIIKLYDENGEYIEFDLKKELAINEDNLAQEMIEQPSKYVYWSSVLEKLRYFQESAELQLEFLEGKLDQQARKDIESQGGRPTKDSIEGYMRRTEEYQRARSVCTHYEYLVKRVHFVVKSLEQRAGMLQSYGKQVQNDKIYGHHAGRYHTESTGGGYNY